MLNDKESGSGINPDREPFITIDDLLYKAQELFTGLKKLSGYKHPLDVRRGARKGVKKRMNDDRQSRQIKGSGRTSLRSLCGPAISRPLWPGRWVACGGLSANTSGEYPSCEYGAGLALQRDRATTEEVGYLGIAPYIQVPPQGFSKVGFLSY